MKKLLSVVLVLAMLLSTLAPFALAQELDNNIGYSNLLSSDTETETDNRIWFDLNGNSRLFVKDGEDTYKNRTTYTDYLPGVDFAGYLEAPTGEFATDQAAVKSPGNGGAMFLYTVDKNTKGSQYGTPDFITGTDGFKYWTINDVKYRVEPEKNVIKTIKNAIDTSALTDAATIARYNSVNAEAVIDVEDGQYKNVGILAGIITGSKSNTRNVVVTLVYSDATEEETATISTDVASTSTSYLTGTFYFKNFTSSNENALGGHTFRPLTIETDPTKTLTAVKINDGTKSSSALCIYVVSAWGEKAGTSDFLSLIEEIMVDGIESLDEYNAVKGYMNSIDAIGDALTSQQKEVYDNTASAIALYEVQLEEIQQEAARQKAMAKRTYNYLTLAADRDVFVTWKDVTDLSRFQFNAEGTSSSAPEGFNTATYDYNGTTIFDWIPFERADGTAVTGEEYFYYKGFKNVALPQIPENKNASAAASNAYLLDDITGENGTKVAGRNVAGISSGGDKAKYGADEYYAGLNGVARATKDTTKTVENPEFLQTLDEDGYFIIKKEAGSETNYKIGPVAQDGYSPNAQIVNSSINNVNAKGTTLDLLITAAGINFNSSYYKKANNAVGSLPVAALQQVTITYEDGETDTKYVVLTNNTIATYDATYSENPVIKTIVFASKYDSQGNEIQYDGNSFYANKDQYDFKALKGNLATVGLDDSVSADAVSFKNPDIIMGANTRVAKVVNLRQDALHNNYGGFSTSAALPLENKKVEAISFPVNQSAAINDPSAIVVIDGAKDASKSTVALLPVEIEGASDDYVYFAYLGRSTSETFVMAATVTEHSSNEKLAAANEAMSKITTESTMQEAKEALELYNIAKEDTYLKDSDFDSALVDTFMNNYTTIRENVKLTGKISVKYYNGEKPSAEVEMYNYAELEGKTYQVILAYYDEKGIYLGSDIFDKATTEAEKETFTVTGEKCPEEATKVKGFIWKGFDKLIPLAEPDETEKKSTFKVLSIGNSYSGNAHKYLVQIAQSAGFEKVVIENLFIGGCTLNTHWTNADGNLPEYDLQRKELVDGKIQTKTTKDVTMLDGIKSEDWDVITIQQGSSQSGKSETYGNLQKIIDYVNENKTNKNAKIVWHQTWAYADDSDVLDQRYEGISQIEMYNKIVSAMESEVLPLKDIDYIIPAGTAIQNARASAGDIVTDSDAVHLNDVGCYTVGLAWLEKITGISADTITYVPEDDTIKANLAAIKKAVKDAIANPYAVTK